ncbi:MAG TPA: cobalamin-binding protein [Bacteroidetes bacterium]|nr:cobalamin-binding protein [Bacteroidota bacterium]
MIFIDQTGYKITLDRHPQRIVSLVPSQTELLYCLVIKPIAQTIFCVHPNRYFKESDKIGGTKKLSLTKIKRLKPDLIIGNKEENQKEQIEQLRKEFPVWLSDIYTLEDSYDMINQVGTILDKELLAKQLVNDIKTNFDKIPQANNSPRALYMIWRKPYMVAGRNTFIQEILQKQGFTNCLDNNESRYPELSIDQIKEYNPDKILLSSEPYPFKDKHMAELQSILPHTSIELVDGELYSWYGPRLLKTAAYLATKSSP